MVDKIRRYNLSDLIRAQPVTLTGPFTAFGELVTTMPTPVVQMDATYGLREKTDSEVFSAGGGAVSAPDTGTGYEFKCETSSTIGSYGLIRSQRAVRYRPGQGTLYRWTARYGTPVALSGMRAGPANIGVELTFGYNGTRFGILYRTGGKQDIQTLTLTVGASGNETASIELNGVTYNVAITSGTAAHNTHEIATDSAFGSSQAYRAFQNNGTVIFVSNSIGIKSGATSYSSTGTSDGSIAQTAAGAAAIDTWYYQEPEDGDSATQQYWNIDPMVADPNGRLKDNGSPLGIGPSGLVLDPSKGNVYQVQYQYLGYGQIKFFIEDPDCNLLQEVHRITYPNNNTSPSLTVPNFKMSWFAFSAGTTTPIEMYGASGAGYVEGMIVPLRNPDSQEVLQSYTTSGFKNIISLRTRRIFQDRINLTDLLLEEADISADGTKTVEWRLYLNADIAGDLNWAYEDEDGSIAEYDTGLGAVTEGSTTILLASGVIGKASSAIIDLERYNIRLLPTQTVTLAARSSSASNIGGSLTWVED